MTEIATRLSWPPIIEHAAEIVRSYETGVTLRQLFYRLVADATLPNTKTAYSLLSRHTAEARRAGWFPALIDRGRTIHRYQTFDGPDDALAWLSRIYRRDRTEGQEYSIYLGVEKAGLVNLLDAWFGDLGLPILPLSGYASQTFVDDVRMDVSSTGRPAVLLYGGDFDPSGEDIDRDFLVRAGCFAEVTRIALTPEQVTEYDLPPALGKATDSRASAFLAKHGQLVQVELDALPPDALRDLYQQAIDRYMDMSIYRAALDRETEERKRL